MPLLALPNELFLEIAGHLKPKDLNHLILTNRRLSYLLNTKLYQLSIKCWRHGTSALYSAAISENHKLVSLLLKNGVNSAGIEKHGLTVFHRLACDSEAAALRVMLEHGVDIDERDEKGRTALHLAVRCEKSLDAFKTLLEWGADINVQEPVYGYTPLHTAVHMESPVAVVLLLQKGADINSRTLKGETPLHLAGQKALHELGDTMFDYMEDPSSWDFSARKITPLEGKITRHEAVVRLLLENRADINAVDTKQRTPLHLAASRGNEQTARLLIDNGASIDIKDIRGLTPLRYAFDMLSVSSPKVSLYRKASLVGGLGRRQVVIQLGTITKRISTSGHHQL